MRDICSLDEDQLELRQHEARTLNDTRSILRDERFEEMDKLHSMGFNACLNNLALISKYKTAAGVLANLGVMRAAPFF